MPQEHSFVKFNSEMKVDGFKVSKQNQDIQELLKNYQDLTSDTILMNNFKKKIEADYISPESLVKDRSFYLYKKTPFQNYYNYVGKLEGNAFTFTDYNIANKEFYHYLATLEKIGEDGLPQYTSYENLDENDQSKYIQAFWQKFSICDIVFDEEKEQYNVEGDTWLLNCNIQSNDITQKTSVTNWDTLGKYGKISIGKKNYDSGSMSCLLGDVQRYIKADGTEIYGYTEKINVNSRYGSEEEKEKAWKIFITNNNLKFLKDTKGNKWIIQILQDSTRNENYNTIGKVTTISFSWEEIEDSNKYPIVSEI